ncbi:TPA: glycosyltransferase family 2 protein [Serratia marcescens]|jgi:IS5 family transposase|uniref:glycosyltransferase family 2 protein n=1 Tax=Serratia TaxID=613 RepID=UPI0004F5D7D1|nr:MULTISPECIES: glycosyltransferase [Serratia]AIM22359.1 family 2 glycosyl transferase [Serratia sp. SCBI]MBH2663913.1 glycosyltransferase [Serratia ureilytica]MBH2720119.1 glycosyltransferase [Serratia ureilytica]MBH3006972.1 glycosyltransferase [Serratia ureilytica]MBH3122815.1 glycosyltransferase [Serratia ureilytica]
MKISAIVPAFNTEKYIGECVRSLLQNDHEKIEIILINDGSTDKTGTILDSFDVPCIKVIHTENQGQSAARNTGLAAASGDYVIFVDSDDKLADNALDRLTDILKDTQSDVVFFESSVFFDDEKLAERFNPKYERNGLLSNFTCSGTHFFQQAVNLGNYIVSPCLYISSRKALKNIQFKNGIVHEDNIFTTRLLLENDITVHCVNEKFYLRRVRHGSVMTQKKGDEHINGYYNCIIELINHPPANANQVQDEYNKFICHMVDCFKYTNSDIIADLKGELIKHNDIVSGEVAGLKREIDELRNSTSWKMTSPLRRMVTFFKG